MATMVRDGVADASMLAMLAEPVIGRGPSLQISSDQGRHDCPGEKNRFSYKAGPEVDKDSAKTDWRLAYSPNHDSKTYRRQPLSKRRRLRDIVLPLPHAGNYHVR